MKLTFLKLERPFGRARVFLLGAATSLFLLLSCGGRPQLTESSAPQASVSPAEREAFAAGVLAARDQAHQKAEARAAAVPPVVWPAPVATATGGRRIDLRAVHDHVHTLERQPDGTWRPSCQGPRRLAPAGKQ
jgi:hypothetical protein